MIGSKIRAAALCAALGVFVALPGRGQQPSGPTPPLVASPSDDLPASAESIPAPGDSPAAPVSPARSGSDSPGYANVGGASLPEITLHAPSFSSTPAHAVLKGSPGQPATVDYGGVLHIGADTVTGDLVDRVFTATNGVHVVATDTTIDAASITLDEEQGLATVVDGSIVQRPYRIRAARIEASSALVDLRGAGLTTTPAGVSPGYEVRAERILLDPVKRSGTAYNAAIYLLGARVLTVHRIRFTLQPSNAGGARRSIIPIFGISKRYGAFTSFEEPLGPANIYALLPVRQSPQIRATTRQHLIVPRAVRSVAEAVPDPQDYVAMIRRYTAIPRPTLPDGDPLTFHSFLPESDPIRLFATRSRGGLDLSEELSSHIASSGNERDDLYVTRLPEIRLSGDAPVTRVLARPNTGDPTAFREYLRHPTIYVGASSSFGQYYEEPTKIRHSRSHYDMGAWSSPLYVLRNTVVVPQIEYSANHYGGSTADYRYWQASVLATHFFTDRAAAGVQYLLSSVSGRSPFNFDVLDTAHEIDGRLQLGDHHFVVAGLIKYDIDRDRVFDYKLTVAPNIHGLVPEFDYDFRSRSIETGLQIEGLSF